MKRTIDMGNFEKIEIMPSSTEEEVTQNVAMITAMTLGSGPMCRDIGVSAETLGMGDVAAKALLTRDIFTAVQDQEPRVTLQSVDIQSGQNGVHSAVMEVEFNG